MTTREYEVPVEGSLGLLALGAVGLKVWREKRKEVSGSDKRNKKGSGERKKEDSSDRLGRS